MAFKMKLSQETFRPHLSRASVNSCGLLCIFALLYVGLFVLASGYKFGNQNFMPVIKAMAAHVPLDQNFNLWIRQYYHLDFMQLCAFLNRFFDLPGIFFIGYCVSLFLFFIGLYLIAQTLFNDVRLSLLAPFLSLLWGSLSVESNIFWQNNTFDAMSSVWPFGLFAIYFFLNRKFFYASLFCGLGLAIHFQIGALIYGALFATLLLATPSSEKKKAVVKFLPGFLLIAALVVWQHRELLSSLKFSIPGLSIDFAAFRMPHHVRLYPVPFLLFFGMIAIGQMAYQRTKLFFLTPEDRQKHLTVLVFCTVIFFSFLVHYADYYILRVGKIVKWQCLRLSPVIHLFACLYVFFLSFRLWAHQNFLFKVFAILLFFVAGPFFLAPNFSKETYAYFFAAGALSLALAVTMNSLSLNAQKKIALVFLLPLVLLFVSVFFLQAAPGGIRFKKATFVFDETRAQGDWISLCKAIKLKTPEDSIFITPPYCSGFLFFAERPMIAEYHLNPLIDSQVVEWVRRMEDLTDTRDLMHQCNSLESCRSLLQKRYLSLTPLQVLAIARKYNAPFFITETRRSYPFYQMASTGQFVLYDLRRTPQTETP